MDTRFSLRVPSDLYEKLKKAAELEKRSINAQVLKALEEYLDSRKI